jgi:hypothetical protein
MLDFMRTMVLFPLHLRLWVGGLFAANFFAPLFFLNGEEGWMVLITGMAAAVAQMIIFARFGFVRLLGLGHFVWFGLVIWLWMRLEAIAPGSALWYWAVTVIVLNSISLVIDVVDVVRFVRGERAPVLELKRG